MAISTNRQTFSSKGGGAIDSLEDWLSSHEHIRPYINFIKSDFRASIFLGKSTRSRTITDLRNFNDTLNSYFEQFQKELETLQTVQKSESLKYASDFGYRKHIFVEDAINEAKSAVISRKLFQLMERQQDVEDLIQLVNSNLIDSSTICAISPSFFTVSYDVDEKEVIYLSEYSKRLTQGIATCIPLWMNDFKLYFAAILQQAMPLLFPKLYYIPHMDYEESLSQCFAELYQKEIKELADEDPEKRPNALFNFCQSIIPDREKMSQEEKAVSLLIVFRVVYELVSTLSQQKSVTEDEKINKVIRLTKLPVKCFTLPSLIAVEDPDVNSREFFQENECLNSAAQEITQSIFEANPIDALYCFHKALSIIDAIARNNVDGEIQTACFDDMFSLFFGSFIASDATDIFFVSKTMNQYLDKFILCPPFEYAMATVEALVIHINNVDISKLETQ